MEKRNLLSTNLRAYQELRSRTLTEFSTELDIPKSTLRTVLKEGNTTLDTAIRIAHGLGVSLDQLVHDESFSDKLFIMKCMEAAGAWFMTLPEESRSEVAEHMASIWNLLSQK